MFALDTDGSYFGNFQSFESLQMKHVLSYYVDYFLFVNFFFNEWKANTDHFTGLFVETKALSYELGSIGPDIYEKGDILRKYIWTLAET